MSSHETRLLRPLGNRINARCTGFRKRGTRMMRTYVTLFLFASFCSLSTSKKSVPKKIPSRNNSQVERAQARLFRLFRFIKLKDKFPSFSTAKAASLSACSRCSPDPLELNELGRARTSTTPFTPRTPLTNSLPFAPTHARTCPRG